jgi:hypothetical protein
LLAVSKSLKVSKVVCQVLLLVVVTDMLIYCRLIHCSPNCTRLVNAINDGMTTPQRDMLLRSDEAHREFVSRTVLELVLQFTKFAFAYRSNRLQISTV